ncbi:MAG: hypothetical protein JRJ85_06265 [Deltaproteobacteria bacterium]|nr:hypothetical protein [Deltaproteobacteria bacterium]
MAFREWKPILPSGLCLDEDTTLSDLPDDLLLILCEEGQGGRLLIYHLIMGALNLGSGCGFETLPSAQLLSLLDIYFMVLDLARFECMRRLGWLEDIPYGGKPIIDFILEVSETRPPAFIKISRLSKAHPAYEQDVEDNDSDIQVLARKYAKEAVKAFKLK